MSLNPTTCSCQLTGTNGCLVQASLRSESKRQERNITVPGPRGGNAALMETVEIPAVDGFPLFPQRLKIPLRTRDFHIPTALGAILSREEQKPPLDTADSLMDALPAVPSMFDSLEVKVLYPT